MTTTRLEQEGGLAVLTLANPPLNQISEQVVDDLVEVVAALEAADDVRALLVRGEGDVFSAGADVELFAGRSAAEMRPLIERFLDLGRRVEALPFPTLAAVHGMCVAGGLELVLFLDLIWAAEGTNLGLLETRLGIVPLAGGIERVAARAGLGRARAIALSGNLFPAEQFEAWGVVDRVLPAEELQPQAEKFAQRLAAGPDTSVRRRKAVRSRVHRGRSRGGRRAPARGRRGPVRHGGRPATRSNRSSRRGPARQHSPGVDPLRLCVRVHEQIGAPDGYPTS